MTGQEIAQVIQATATLVTACGVAYGIIVSRGNSKKADEISAKVEEVHLTTNGKLRELVDMTARANKSEGKEEERTEERARQSEAITQPTQSSKPNP